MESLEDTPNQSRLNAKIEELAHVFCCKEFIDDIYLTLKQDREFAEYLYSEWEIELSEQTLLLYRMLEMYRQPLVRIDTGYHVPTTAEVIDGIRAFFDPKDINLASPSAAHNSRFTEIKRMKALIISMLQHNHVMVDQASQMFTVDCLEAAYLRAFCSYPFLYFDMVSRIDLIPLIENGFSVSLPSQYTTPEVSDVLSTVTATGRLDSLISDPRYTSVRLIFMLWKCFMIFLDKAGTGSACECPLIYSFVRYCLGQGVGVPKPAQAVYDRMNMQLSKKPKCANPSCELNKLDQSTDQVKFKQCSRCLAVMYCSRECQVAHYPRHKKFCHTHSH